MKSSFLYYTLVQLLSTGLLCQGFPADPHGVHPFNSGASYDPPPEPLTPYYGEDAPYLAAFNDVPFSRASASRSIRYQKDIDLNQMASEEETEERKYTAPVPMEGSSRLSSTDDDASRDERKSARFKNARAMFRLVAEGMGSLLLDDHLRSRFNTYASKELQEDLLSGDDNKKRLATASIMMHRPPQSKKQEFSIPERFSNASIYHGLKKEEILERLFEVMRTAPTEDLRSWWYYRIILSKDRKDVFNDLYSNIREKQIRAIKFITGLYPLGYFWVKDRPNPNSPWSYDS